MSLPARSSTVNVQINHVEETEASPRDSQVASGCLQSSSQPSCCRSAAVLPSSAGLTSSGLGRNHVSSQWLSPEDAAATTTACLSSYETSSRLYRSPQVSVDVGDVMSLTELDLQLQALNRWRLSRSLSITPWFTGRKRCSSAAAGKSVIYEGFYCSCGKWASMGGARNLRKRQCNPLLFRLASLHSTPVPFLPLSTSNFLAYLEPRKDIRSQGFRFLLCPLIRLRFRNKGRMRPFWICLCNRW